MDWNMINIQNTKKNVWIHWIVVSEFEGMNENGWPTIWLKSEMKSKIKHVDSSK